MSDELPTIAIAGASGFIGRALCQHLADKFQLVGLTRDPERAARTNAQVQWRRCDLFSRRETFAALEGCTHAVYLVHSMLPSARLTQGSFRNMDLICADNFARAAAHQNLEHIVYVGEILPDCERMPEHFLSRLEVEESLNSYPTPVTTLRPGLVLGPGGDTTEMLARLVERLPLMALPAWTTSRLSPIARADLVELIDYALHHPQLAGQSFDVGGSELVTYRELIELTAQALQKKRRYFQVPACFPRLSTAWVSFFTNRPPDVVAPLVEGLSLDLIPSDQRLQKQAGQQPRSPKEAIAQALTSTELVTRPTSKRQALKRLHVHKLVRSIQRLPLPKDHDALWVAREYARWLPRFMRPFMHVATDNNCVRFHLRPLPWPLLALTLDDDVSHPDRQLYWITGGLLVRPHPPARLEFREALGSRYCLAAIHDFRPRLPWTLYRLTQAQVHAFVMHAFGRHLARLARA